MKYSIGISILYTYRSKTFAALLQQECGWFDDEDNSTGALSARLTDDAGDLQEVCIGSHSD